MCAIIDNNVRSELVSADATEVGRLFRDWLSSGKGKLVVGGKLLEELCGNEKVKLWLANGRSAGHVIGYQAAEIQRVSADVARHCKSDDPHVVALAKVSGARLLYTRDHDLMEDFRNRKLLGGRIAGKIYTDASDRTTVGPQHRRLLDRRDLCETTKNR